MRRFPAEQAGKDSTSYEYRPIDDATASGLNVSTSFKERLKMDGLCALLMSAHAVNSTFQSWGEDGLPVFAKGDQEKAYRQWAVSPEELNLLVRPQRSPLWCYQGSLGIHKDCARCLYNSTCPLRSPAICVHG